MTFDKSIENVKIRIDFDSVEVDSIVFKYQITRSSFGLFVNLSKSIETSKSIENYRNVEIYRKISKSIETSKNIKR